MPSWKKIITSGSSAHLNQITASGQSHFASDVGIGTTSPAESLDVSGGNIRLDDGQKITFGGTLTEIDSAGSDLRLDAADEVHINPQTAIKFFIASSDKMIINSSGKVGIGTASPTTTLDVSGSMRSTSETITPSAGLSFTWTIDFTESNNYLLEMDKDTILSASRDDRCVGQSGIIAFRQDGSGGHDLTLESKFKTPRGASITWDDGADEINLISYYVVSQSLIAINYMGNFS